MTAPLASRLIIGAIAGMTATSFMTAAMRRLHARLPATERYPLPPREITQRLMPVAMTESRMRDASLLAHFGFGAVAGALIAGADVRKSKGAGALLGVGVWTLSYFGWVPGFHVLEPADEHPARRNALMIAVHLIWGGATNWTIGELTEARRTMLARGPLKDAPEPQTKHETLDIKDGDKP